MQALTRLPTVRSSAFTPLAEADVATNATSCGAASPTLQTTAANCAALSPIPGTSVCTHLAASKLCTRRSDGTYRYLAWGDHSIAAAHEALSVDTRTLPLSPLHNASTPLVRPVEVTDP